MATPHIEAEIDEIANIVLMPGDPLRAKHIAETYLTNVKIFNDVRNILGYTGYYNGKRVSVMGSGMGMPSIGIYSYELFKYYNVDKIIRLGSCGALIPDLKVYDVVLVDASYSDSTYAYIQSETSDKIMKPSLALTNHLEDIAEKENINITKGMVYSTDVFYDETFNYKVLADEYNCIALEMETFALFHNANICSKEAAAILTVSDSLVTKENTNSLEREKSFNKMVELALKSL